MRYFYMENEVLSIRNGLPDCDIITGMGRDNTEQLISELTPRQRALLEEVRLAKIESEKAVDNYGRSIFNAHQGGMSYGVIGYELGVDRVALFRREKRYLAGGTRRASS